MTKKEIIKPKDGLQVRKPDGTHLKKDGEKIELNSYWRRRLADGSIEVIAAAKPTKTNKQEA